MDRIQRHSMLLLEGLNVFVLAQKFSKGCSCLFRLHCACVFSGTRLWFIALSHSQALKRWRCSGNPLEGENNKCEKVIYKLFSF